ncbi:hypothetical protein [uncultured Fibrella sp.]
MNLQANTPAPRLTLKKERLVCLTTAQSGSKAGGRTCTTVFTAIY